MDAIDLYLCKDGVWRPLDKMSPEDVKNNPEAKRQVLTFEDFVELVNKYFPKDERASSTNGTFTWACDSSKKPDQTVFYRGGRGGGWATMSKYVEENREEIEKRISEILRKSSTS